VIATCLFFGLTVRTHLRQIYEMMDVHLRVELLAKLRWLRACY
jgi:DNA-binding CsgD family transcriptional regulator